MNEYDTEIIRAVLTQNGFAFVDDIQEADTIILNTCAVRENAARKVYGMIHTIRHELNGRPHILGVLGCMATHLRTELLDDPRLNIDFIAGPDSYRRLPELIEQAGKRERPGDVALSPSENYDGIAPRRVPGVNAWVAVMRGCNNFCSFCVVPYTRGRERSRPVAQVIPEIERLAQEGFKQVTLLGQNVNSYHDGDKDFADLLAAASRVGGIKRIRFMSPHPKDFPGRILDTIATNPKVCKHIHLPLQAGGDRILKMMNRTYTQADYLALVKKIRRLCPGIAITTDIIVGFPSESAADFQDTVAVMQAVEFDAAFIFKYSERKGTIAAREFPDDVSEGQKTERIVRLNDLQRVISLRKNTACVGRIEEIMIEDLKTARSAAAVQGRTGGNKIVIIPQGPYHIGQMIAVKITAATPHVLKGSPAADAGPSPTAMRASSAPAAPAQT